MNEGGRRLGIAGTLGMAAVMAAGCGTSEDADDYKFDISFQSQTGQKLDCEIENWESDPEDESIIILRGVNCPDKTQTKEIFNTDQAKFRELYIDLNNSIPFAIQAKNPDATPIIIFE